MAGRTGGDAPLAGARRRRRWAAVALGVGLLAGAMILAPPAGGQEHGHDGEGHLPPGDWTAEQEMALHDLITRTEAELPAFADVSTLPALGFHDFGITVDGWAHWINRGWVDDDHILDPTHPESLVYRSTAQGGWELQAAMFILPTDYDLENIPEDLAWMPGWHQHPELCVTPDWRYAGLTDMDGTCWSGAPSDMPPMMHVWLVDPGCGHRFGGVGVGGLHCDVGHDHGPDPTTPTTGSPTSTTTSTTSTVPTVPSSVPIVPQSGTATPQATGTPAPRQAPAARPVRAQPRYAG